MTSNEEKKLNHLGVFLLALWVFGAFVSMVISYPIGFWSYVGSGLIMFSILKVLEAKWRMRFLKNG